jgi:hypothetical protein
MACATAATRFPQAGSAPGRDADGRRRAAGLDFAPHVRGSLQRILLVCLIAAAAACDKPSPAPSGNSCAGTPGVPCFGRQSYVEYDPGALPIVVSVPHGGALAPANIPDRTVGTTVTDSNTIDLGRAIVQAFVARTGKAPHLILCHLRRTKLDANREVSEAAQGNADAVQAWTEYHDFVGQAAREVVARSGRGFYIDLHGHGHTVQRLELGYLLSSTTLDRSDAELNGGNTASQSSLRLLMLTTPKTFAEALRGTSSLGGLLAASTASVPSPATPSPGNDDYFTGGYSTERHSATLPGLQIESHFTGIRDTAASRIFFAEALVAALVTFVSTHLGLTL